MRLWMYTWALMATVATALAASCDGATGIGTSGDAGVNAYINDDAGGAEGYDAGGGTGLALGGFCTTAGVDGVCYGAASRAVFVGPLEDGGVRAVNAIGSAWGEGTQLIFSAQYPLTSPTAIVGTMSFTQFSCPDFMCPVACRYGAADGGGVEVTGTLYRFDPTEIEVEARVGDVVPIVNSDGGCPVVTLVTQLRLAGN